MKLAKRAKETEMKHLDGDQSADARDNTDKRWQSQETKEEMDETDVAFGETYSGDTDAAADENEIFLKVEGMD